MIFIGVPEIRAKKKKNIGKIISARFCIQSFRQKIKINHLYSWCQKKGNLYFIGKNAQRG